MLIAKNDEEERSRLWRIVTMIATALIILIAMYFMYKTFLGNPLEGSWEHDESDMVLQMKGKNTALLSWKELIDGKDVEVTLDYTLDKKEKLITFKVEQSELEAVSKELGSDVTSEAVKSAVSSMITSFNYSVESNELTLTEWDYGDQMLFNKIK